MEFPTIWQPRTAIELSVWRSVLFSFSVGEVLWDFIFSTEVSFMDGDHVFTALSEDPSKPVSL